MQALWLKRLLTQGCWEGVFMSLRGILGVAESVIAATSTPGPAGWVPTPWSPSSESTPAPQPGNWQEGSFSLPQAVGLTVGAIIIMLGVCALKYGCRGREESALMAAAGNAFILFNDTPLSPRQAAELPGSTAESLLRGAAANRLAQPRTPQDPW